MDYGIRRLQAGKATLFHLFDKWGRLRFVADQGSPWLVDKPGHYVRLARADGHLVGTLNLPWLGEETAEENGRLPIKELPHPQSYAILINHAVYAVIEILPEDKLFILEVEHCRWLLRLAEDSNKLLLFADAPTPFHLKLKQFATETADPEGWVEPDAFGYDFGVMLPKKRPLRHPAILVLALVVLLEKHL